MFPFRVTDTICFLLFVHQYKRFGQIDSHIHINNQISLKSRLNDISKTYKIIHLLSLVCTLHVALIHFYSFTLSCAPTTTSDPSILHSSLCAFNFFRPYISSRPHTQPHLLIKPIDHSFIHDWAWITIKSQTDSFVSSWGFDQVLRVLPLPLKRLVFV